jgi:hypothetical protein
MTKAERAKYMQDYRKTVKPLNEREAREEGFKAGVAACVLALRLRGEHVLAHRLELINTHESYELQQQRGLIRAISPRNGV